MNSKQETIVIGGTEIKPGQRAAFEMKAARLYTHTQLEMPVQVVHGKKPGPRLFVCAAIHGDEILGVEIIRRLLKLKIVNRIKGTVIAIPVVNVFGFINQSRYSPDRRDLNRFFPGAVGGSLTSQLANLFMEEIVSKCTHGIDLHTGSNHRSNLPQIRAYLDDPETERLAQAFGAPVILDADVLTGSLRQAVKDRGIPMLLYEAGEVLRFDEVAIKAGVRGIIGVMRAIGMLPTRNSRKLMIQPLIARSSTWMRAPVSGVLRSTIRLGDRIKNRSVLGEITDPFGESTEKIYATTSGVIIGRLHLPLVHQGDALFHIARIGDSASSATATIEAFRQEFEPDA